MNNKHFYFCQCGTEAVVLDDWEDYPGLSLWRAGASYSPRWQHRLRHIWNIVRYGHPYTDDILLSKESARELGEKLIELADRIERREPAPFSSVKEK